MRVEPEEAAAGADDFRVVPVDNVDCQRSVRTEERASQQARFLEGVEELLAAGGSYAVAILGLEAYKDLKMLDFLTHVEFRVLGEIDHVASNAPACGAA